MISSGPNPRALRRCLPGSVYPTCVYALSHAPAVVAPLANRLSESRCLRLPTTPSLQIHPFARTKAPTHRFPQPHITALQTEQNPLKIDLPAKV
jgi:hypothetical protein